MHQAGHKLIFDALGWLGALLFLVSYALLITKRWSSTHTAYHVFNILGGILIGTSALYDHSFPGAFINIMWAMLALYGLYRDHNRFSP
ncbi:MAG: hypothetical protein INR69_06830 [Mucilaginibacter polytrichastri]|nr:hypothetical protein [Mucilaginibacter polytrichastri]